MKTLLLTGLLGLVSGSAFAEVQELPLRSGETAWVPTPYRDYRVSCEDSSHRDRFMACEPKMDVYGNIIAFDIYLSIVKADGTVSKQRIVERLADRASCGKEVERLLQNGR